MKWRVRAVQSHLLGLPAAFSSPKTAPESLRRWNKNECSKQGSENCLSHATSSNCLFSKHRFMGPQLHTCPLIDSVYFHSTTEEVSCGRDCVDHRAWNIHSVTFYRKWVSTPIVDQPIYFPNERDSGGLESLKTPDRLPGQNLRLGKYMSLFLRI
jgi:hypothetical protein